jgi:hypothetical protein
VKKVIGTGMKKALKMAAREVTQRAMKRDTRKDEKTGMRQLLKRGVKRGDAAKSLGRDQVLLLLSFTVVSVAGQ